MLTGSNIRAGGISSRASSGMLGCLSFGSLFLPLFNLFRLVLLLAGLEFLSSRFLL